MLTDTAMFRNPNYHTRHDTADTLDFVFMAAVARAVTATLLSSGLGRKPDFSISGVSERESSM